jgi:hypothetical protein
MKRRRTPAAAVLLCLAVACTGAPEPAITPSTSPPRAVTPSPSAAPQPIPFTAAALRRALTAEALASHLRRLQAIADENGGIRSAATPGYERSADYAASVFRAAGFRVRFEPFEMPVFDLAEPSRLEGAGLDLRDGRDFRAAIYSGSGDVTGPVADAGYGCSSSGFGAGVALVRYGGGCATSSKVRNAQAAGAVAVLVIRSDSVPGAPIRPTLGSPEGIEVPVLALTPPAGDAIAGLGGGEVRVSVRAERPIRTTRNVVAEIGPRTGPVLMAGGHLDSVIDGPGINDNGSGSAAVLALAQALGRVRRPPRVRLALWSGEEYFLLGSIHHVENLDRVERAEIEAYINFDMIGSPNAAHLVYDGDAEVRDALVAGLRGLPYELEAMQGNSDHAPFADAGIDVGGIFTGALEPISELQAQRFGAVAGRPADACYHQACDDLHNVDLVLAERMADALAEAVVILAGTG